MPLEAGRMHGFVASLLAESGGLVEPLDPDGLAVLAPPDLQRALGIGEFSRFGFGASLPDGAQRIGIESDCPDEIIRAEFNPEALVRGVQQALGRNEEDDETRGLSVG